jgi:hypothetical protein
MVRPVFIVCSRDGAEDKGTGLISIFQVIEKFLIVKLDSAKLAGGLLVAPAQSLRMVATWMLEPEKGEQYGDWFEYEVRLVMPPRGTVIRLGGDTFAFSDNQPLHRFTLQLETALPFEGPGIMWVESCVRKPGADWAIQSYPIILEEIGESPARSPSG